MKRGWESWNSSTWQKKKRLKDSHEHVHNAYKYLMGRSKDIRTRDFLSVVHSDRTKGNGQKMKYRKYLLKFLLRKNVSMSGWSNQVAQRPWSMHRNNPCATYCSWNFSSRNGYLQRAFHAQLFPCSIIL